MADTAVEHKCKNHPLVEATFKCADCGKYFCDACKVEYEGEAYCTNCRKISIQVVLTKIKTWRIPWVAALIIGAAFGYVLFTGFVYGFADSLIGVYSDKIISLSILFVASSALLAGIVSGLLTREKLMLAGVFAGLLLLAVHIAVDFVYDYFELPIEGTASNVQRVVSMSYYAMLAGICGTVGGWLASKVRRTSE